MKIVQDTFRGLRAVRLTNGVVDVATQIGGGHIAELRLTGSPINPLWQPPWAAVEPDDYAPDRYPQYGREEGRLLASIAGHALCLNHFGELSEAEIAAEGFEHGEAANLTWQIHDFRAEKAFAHLDYGLELPEAGMRFMRRLEVRAGESCVRFEEEVTNLRRSDTPLAYQQHVTLGPPFVEPGTTRLDLSGVRAHTFPSSLGDADPVRPNAGFTWPDAPGAGPIDVFPDRAPLCSVCTVALEPEGETSFVAISNPRLQTMLAYVFPGQTYPWAALWYENGGITSPPYNGKTLAWGIEFGTCPFPETRINMLANGPLLGRRRFGVLRALETLRTSYVAILQRIPADWQGVAHISTHGNTFVIQERNTGRHLTVGGGSQL